MPAESIAFDVFARTESASRNIKQLGDAALETSGKLGVAAAAMKLLDETTQKQGKAAATSEAAMKSHAKATNLLADAENVLAGRATVTTKLLTDQGRESEKAGKSVGLFGSAASAAAGTGGIPGGGMGALIAAGASLAPVLVTLGVGLAGFGAAAVGVAAPVLKAAQATGGLQANMAKLNPEQRQLAVSILGLGKQYSAFEKSLQPQVLGVFNKGIQLAGHVMGDLQPIAKSTGVALELLLGRIDAEFKSGTWQQFFTWMAAQAGPDLRLVGNAFISLLNTLPPLLKLLNPVAVDFLAIVDAGTKLIGKAAEVGNASEKTGQHMGALAQITTALRLALFAPGVGLYHALQLIGVISSSTADATQALTDRLKAAHTATADLIHPLNSAAVGTGVFASSSDEAKIAAQHEASAVTTLTLALKGLSSGLLTSEQDQVSWKQAQQAATAAIKANTGSLDSNRATALTARAAIIQSTQAALTFANQEVNVHHNVAAASTIIQDQINWLEKHAGKSKIAAAEVDALRQALAKLKNKAVTLTETGTGIFKINSSSTPALAKPKTAAAGLFINRGTSATADDVLIRASKGELIVPTNMVNAGAVDHLRGRIPGFAGGGLAGLPGQTTAFDSRFQSQFTAAMKSAMTAAMRAAVSAARAAAASAVGALGGPTSASAAQAQAYARSRLGAYGWGSGQMGSLIPLWNQESGWNRLARNPSSGAYGIPQALPPGKMGAAANPPTSSAAAQINWGLSYIKGRYGSPAGAEMHEQRFHWYDQGGWMPPGASLSYNGTGQPEQVVGPGGMARVEMLLAQILAATRTAPAATSAGTARALNSAARGAMGAR